MNEQNEIKTVLTADVSGLKKGFEDGKKEVDAFGKSVERAGSVSEAASHKLDTVGDTAGKTLGSVDKAMGAVGAAAQEAARNAAEAAGASGGLAESVGRMAAQCTAGAVGLAGLALVIGGALAVAFREGRSEAEGYTKALILTGNAAGETVGQLADVAAAAARATGATQGAVAQVVAQVVETGVVMRENMDIVTEATVRMERAGVQSVDKMVKAFEELGKDPVKASEKLNEATNYLTANVYAQIKALEEQGKVSEAAALAQRTYAESSIEAATQIEASWGTLQRMARGVQDAAKGMWDAVLGIGRQKSMSQQIADQRKLIDDIREGRETGNIDVAQNYLSLLEKQVATDQRGAQVRAEGVATEKARVEWMKVQDQYQSKEEKREQELLRVRNLGLAAGASEVEIEKELGRVREKYADPKPRHVAGPRFDYQAYAADLAQVNSVRRQEELFLRGHLDEMQALYRMGLVQDEDYVRARTETALQEIAAEERRYQGLAAVAKKYGRGGDATRAAEELKILQAQRAQTEAAGERELLVLGVQRQRQLDSWVLSERDALDAIDFERSLIGKTTEEIERMTYARRVDLQVRNATRFADGTLKVPATVADAYESAGEVLKRQRGQQAAQEAADRGDWLVGARKGLADYERLATNVADHVERAFGNAAQAMEDSIVNFALTGKLNFSGLVNSILADIVRMQARAALSPIFSAIAGGLSSYFGLSSSSSSLLAGSSLASGTNLSYMGGGQGLSYGGALAGGGPADAGKFYEVAENGPELLTTGGRTFLMMGSSSGAVTPAGTGGGGGGMQSVRVELINAGSPQEVTGVTPRIDAEGMVVQIFTRDLKRNGPMAQALSAFGSRR